MIYNMFDNMFSDSIDNRINKFKVNFDSYLSQRKNTQPPVPSIRRPEINPSTHPTHPPPISNSISAPHPSVAPGPPQKPTELQAKQLIINAKTYEKQPINLKTNHREKSIQITYNEEQLKLKLQIKMLDNNLDIRINTDKSSIEIGFKRASRFKFHKPQGGQPMWMTMNSDIKDDKILIHTTKDGKTLKSYFDMVPEQMIKVDDGKDQKQTENDKDEHQQVPEDVINFLLPGPQQFNDTQKFRRALKDMKEDEKTMILMDIFKIKKEYDDPVALDRKRLKCPIHSCQKIYRQISQLKTHLRKHPQLNKHGIEFTDFGTFEYSSKAIDLALYLGKLFPFEMKKIIRKMKTRTAE